MYKFKYNENHMYYMYFLFLILISLTMFIYTLFFLKYNISIFYEWEMLYFQSFYLTFIIFIDWKALLFLFVVFFISSLVTLYSMKYMEKQKMKFIMLIFLFVMSMMMFIITPNIIIILIGWDGLGVISYVLIIFFQSFNSKNSGMLTIMLNRIGDIFIIFSSWFFFLNGNSNFLFFENFNLFLGMNFIILASMTKSAQMPFSSWLPAAMAAPTPVSSLVHSSTLVTAGIYLMFRFNMYMMESKFMMNFLFLMSITTMFMSGLAANLENDLKKIIALSTLSQLGLLMMTLSIGMLNYSFFHLSTHALFKALMFLCSGVMIHNFKNMQDIRFFGQMIKFMPITVMCFNTANLSLSGFPFLSGFYSKDLIIESFLMNNKSLFSLFILLISTSLTVSYTIRLIFFLTFSKKNTFFLVMKQEDFFFNIILFILTFFSVTFGLMLNRLLFFNFMFNEMNMKLKMIIPMIMLMGMIMGMMFIKLKKNTFFSSMWLLNFLIPMFNKVPYYLTEKTFLVSNFGFFEYFSGQGMKTMVIIWMLNNNNMMKNIKMLLLLSIMTLSLWF